MNFEYYIVGNEGRLKGIIQEGGNLSCLHCDVLPHMKNSFGGGGWCPNCGAGFVSFDIVKNAEEITLQISEIPQ